MGFQGSWWWIQSEDWRGGAILQTTQSRGQDFPGPQGPSLNLVGPRRGPFLLVCNSICSKGCPFVIYIWPALLSTWEPFQSWPIILPFFATHAWLSEKERYPSPTTIIIKCIFHFCNWLRKWLHALDHPLVDFCKRSRSWIVGPFSFHIIQYFQKQIIVYHKWQQI